MAVSELPDLASIVRQVAAAVNGEESLALLAAAMQSSSGATAIEIRERNGVLHACAGTWPERVEPTDTTLHLPLHRGTATVGFVRLLTVDAELTLTSNPALATLLDLAAMAIEPLAADAPGIAPSSSHAGESIAAFDSASVESAVFDFVSELVCTMSGADFAFSSYRFAGDPCMRYGAHGMRSLEWRGLLTRADGSLNDRALAGMEAIVIGAANLDARALPGEVSRRYVEGAQSLVCVPAGEAGDELVVTAGWRRTVRVEGYRLDSIQQIVDRFSCLLHGDAGRHVLSRLDSAVETSGASMELDALCAAILEQAANDLAVDHCAVLLADDRNGGLTPLARRGLPHAFFRGFAAVMPGPQSDTSRAAFALGRTVVTPDIMEDEGWAPYRELAAPLGLRAAWSAPIVGYGTCAVGALTAYVAQSGPPSDWQQALLEVYASIVARAYDQSRQARRAQSTSDPAAVMGAQLSSIVGQLPCGLIVLDEHHRVVFRNDTAMAVCHELGFELDKDDLSNASLYLNNPNHELGKLEHWQSPVGRALRGESVPSCEMHLEAADSGHSDKSVMVSAAPLRDESGRIVGAAVMLSDTRKERNLADGLATVEAQLRAIQAATPYGVALYDARGEQIWATDATEQFAHCSLDVPADSTDDTMLDLADEHGHPLRVADLPIMQVLRTGQPVRRRIVQSRGPDGRGRWLQLDAAAVEADDSSPRRFVVSALDITEHKQTELALSHQAMYDALTGLPNRTWFNVRLEEAITQLNELGSAALLVLDIDRFREVNDTLGHANGDILVQLFAKRLVGAVGLNGFVGRLGGDEFGILIERASVVDATSMARRILHQLEHPFEIAGQTLDVDASIGVALCPDHGTDINALLRRADIAMYVAKHSHDGFAVYTARLDLHSPDRLSLLGELRRSIEQGHLFLAYQPLIRISDQKLIGMEALVRWQHPVHGLIYPDGFISLAEGTGAIKPLTIWVLNEALRQCGEWRSHGYDLQVSVNLSARSLHDVTLASSVLDSLLRFHVPPDRLTIEITESAIMSDPSSAMIVLSRLSNMGVHLAIDDFGTGYSSLAYLQRLPTRNIKIDKSFVLRLCENANDAAIVRAIIELGHSLGHSVLAEGVEHESVLELLSRLGCDFAQGYYFSKPLPASEIEDWIRKRL